MARTDWLVVNQSMFPYQSLAVFKRMPPPINCRIRLRETDDEALIVSVH